MKKIILMIAMIAITAGASAQIQWGVRAGMNISTISYSGENEMLNSVNLKNRTGFHVGAIVDLNVAENFYIQPGLFFTTRGAKINESKDGETYKMDINANYLQIPVVASYRFPINKSIKIDVNVGPYVSYGLGGKLKAESSFEGETDKEEIKIFEKSTEDKDGGDMKRFDAGMRFGAGVQCHKFYIGLSYDLGLANIVDGNDNDMNSMWMSKDKIKNRNITVSVGYNF